MMMINTMLSFQIKQLFFELLEFSKYLVHVLMLGRCKLIIRIP